MNEGSHVVDFRFSDETITIKMGNEIRGFWTFYEFFKGKEDGTKFEDMKYAKRLKPVIMNRFAAVGLREDEYVNYIESDRNTKKKIGKFRDFLDL